MEIGKQIKNHRTKLSLSQEEFADKIFVTRQTVSNWENDKSYPDINSLVLMAEVFGVSLDSLVKGDIEKMQEEIKKEDREKLKKSSGIMTVVMVWLLFSLVPLVKILDVWGAVIYFVIAATGIIYAVKVEKDLKKLDIRTFKEVSAFMDGKRLDEIEKQREIGKRPYQKIFLAIGSAILAFAVTCLLAVIFKLEI